MYLKDLVCRGAIAILLILGGCSCSRPQDHERQRIANLQKAGWHYMFEDGDDRGALIYRFSDNSDDYFSALCDMRPSFRLKHRGYEGAPMSFSLQIDQQSWTFPRYYGGHSNALLADDPRLAQAFATARKRIVFRVGRSWSIDVPPSVLLKRFIDECRDRNKPDVAHYT